MVLKKRIGVHALLLCVVVLLAIHIEAAQGPRKVFIPAAQSTYNATRM